MGGPRCFGAAALFLVHLLRTGVPPLQAQGKQGFRPRRPSLAFAFVPEGITDVRVETAAKAEP